jgi:hypothetical protein
MTMQQAYDMKHEANIALMDDGRGFVVMNGDVIAAKILCCDFTQNSCHVHMVIQDSKVLQDNFLAKELFRFTFEVLERTMLIATASSLNEGSLALQRAYGFEEVCRIPDAFSDGEDMVISTLTRERHMRRRIH